MKNPSRYLITNAIIAVLMMLLFFSASSALAAPVKVAILPFDVHAKTDLTFLQEGILDMLGSRLAWQDNVEIINNSRTISALASVEEFGGDSRALLVGGKLQADYVLFGSLTEFGESVSIDAKMVDVRGQQAPLPFFAQTNSMGDVIPQINQFATNINQTVFGRAAAQLPAGTPSPQSGTVPIFQPQLAPQADETLTCTRRNCSNPALSPKRRHRWLAKPTRPPIRPLSLPHQPAAPITANEPSGKAATLKH